MRIGINALAVSPERPGGDVSYVIELIRRLPNLDPETEWVVFATPPAMRLLGQLPASAEYAECRVPGTSIIARALWEQTALVSRAARARLDLLHAPVNVSPLAYPGKTVLTLHEAEPFMPASGIPLALLMWWRTMRQLSARRAARLLTVSHAAREQLQRWMGLPEQALQVVHLGVDLARFSAQARQAPAPLDGNPYLLWVGRPYPRKNLDTLLSAYAELRKAGRPERLVLIGPPGWNEAALSQRITSEFEPGTVVRLPAIWTELPGWYAHAAAFVFPSTQETFGLPLLEAMASGAPVVAGDIPALREIGGDAAIYVPPLNVHELASAVGGALDSRVDALRLREAGFEQARRFSWDATARRTLAVYRDVAHAAAV